MGFSLRSKKNATWPAFSALGPQLAMSSVFTVTSTEQKSPAIEESTADFVLLAIGLSPIRLSPHRSCAAIPPPSRLRPHPILTLQLRPPVAKVLQCQAVPLAIIPLRQHANRQSGCAKTP